MQNLQKLNLTLFQIVRLAEIKDARAKDDRQWGKLRKVCKVGDHALFVHYKLATVVSAPIFGTYLIWRQSGETELLWLDSTKWDPV